MWPAVADVRHTKLISFASESFCTIFLIPLCKGGTGNIFNLLANTPGVLKNNKLHVEASEVKRAEGKWLTTLILYIMTLYKDLLKKWLASLNDNFKNISLRSNQAKRVTYFFQQVPGPTRASGDTQGRCDLGTKAVEQSTSKGGQESLILSRNSAIHLFSIWESWNLPIIQQLAALTSILMLLSCLRLRLSSKSTFQWSKLKFCMHFKL